MSNFLRYINQTLSNNPISLVYQLSRTYLYHKPYATHHVWQTVTDTHCLCPTVRIVSVLCPCGWRGASKTTKIGFTKERSFNRGSKTSTRECKQTVRKHSQDVICKKSNNNSIGGSVVECSPATRAARVRFPADANLYHPIHNIYN